MRRDRAAPCWISLLTLVVVALLAPARPAAAADWDHPADVAYERGARSFRQGDLAAASDHLLRARELAPESARIALLLGITLTERGDFDAGREQLQAALLLEPENALAHLFLGIAFQEFGEPERAEAALESARRLDPELEGAVAYRLGLLALGRRNPDAARAQFELARGGADDLVARSAEVFLRAPSAPRRWGAAATLGAEYDSNPRVESRTRDRDWLNVFEVDLASRLVDAERITAYAGLQSSFSAYADENDFNLAQNRGTLFVSARLAERLDADVEYFFESLWAGYDSYRRRHFVEPALRIRPRDDHSSARRPRIGIPQAGG